MSALKLRKIGIFYLSKHDGKDRQAVSVGPATFPPKVVYVRCEMSTATDLSDALDQAKPRRGETVMNTHYVD
jgi:hypothetical protein